MAQTKFSGLDSVKIPAVYNAIRQGALFISQGTDQLIDEILAVLIETESTRQGAFIIIQGKT